MLFHSVTQEIIQISIYSINLSTLNSTYIVYILLSPTYYYILIYTSIYKLDVVIRIPFTFFP